jgi:hypothetical protein
MTTYNHWGKLGDDKWEFPLLFAIYNYFKMKTFSNEKKNIWVFFFLREGGGTGV